MFVIYFGHFVMQWSEVSKLSHSQFQRLVDVRRTTFDKMIATIELQSKQRVSNRGCPGSIVIENQLLIMLMYYREYRTFFHISIAYGISEAQCWRIVRKLETMLIKSSLFHLPGKKQLTQNNTSWEVVVIDVGESPVERPKKNSAGIIQAKRSGTH
ncbi:MAG: transposase family protein [Panacibacter sp.]